MIDLAALSGQCLGGLLDAAIKSLALALLASACLAMGRARSPAWRHAVWATLLCGMLGLPFLSLMIPAVVLPVLPSASAPTTAAPATQPMAVLTAPARLAQTAMFDEPHPPRTGQPPRALPASARRRPQRLTWTVIAFVAYLAGVAVLLFRLFLGLAGCRRIVRASRAIAVDKLMADRSREVFVTARARRIAQRARIPQSTALGCLTSTRRPVL